ncbi:hypothetical protein GCM10010172_74300 [Paractinoplanes ferrugineus]|uniref:Uncharacterized protein n=1 Tax=Paractinoplanes ferrugineus TaxID=113564 RepID=A0A919J0E0_9ACTN|nr:hypothetical protein Afe05nite_32540 [Actinoplanes ferrugineus]
MEDGSTRRSLSTRSDACPSTDQGVACPPASSTPRNTAPPQVARPRADTGDVAAAAGAYVLPYPGHNPDKKAGAVNHAFDRLEVGVGVHDQHRARLPATHGVPPIPVGVRESKLRLTVDGVPVSRCKQRRPRPVTAGRYLAVATTEPAVTVPSAAVVPCTVTD